MSFIDTSEKKKPGVLLWWLMALIQALRKQTQADHCELKISLFYIVSFELHTEILSGGKKEKAKQKKKLDVLAHL